LNEIIEKYFQIIQDYTERKYICISDNKKYCIVQRVLLKASFNITNFNSTQEDCSATIYEYITFDQEGGKSKMAIDFNRYPSRESLSNGNKS
jgi:hypothetical protein